MDIMEISLGTGLWAALDAAAPDESSWLAGAEVFWAQLPEGTVGEALWAALDAAAPDESSWLAGQEAFEKNYDESWWFFERFTRGRISSPFRDSQFSPRQLRRNRD